MTGEEGKELDKEEKKVREENAVHSAQSENSDQPENSVHPELPEVQPSPKQMELAFITSKIHKQLGEHVLIETSLNELNDDMPILVIDPAFWPMVANLLKTHDELQFNYLRNVSGVDYETHLEVVYHLLALTHKREVAVKIRTSREAPSVPSAAMTWSTANWNEREIYDLLGVDFPGHPDLRRIMMPDDWEGYPLRKDYEPLDPEV